MTLPSRTGKDTAFDRKNNIKIHIKNILTKTPVFDIMVSEQNRREAITMKIGYARVSTLDQNLDRQLDNLKEQGCERIFSEKMTGTKADRPELQRMLEMLREGDVVVVDSFSRLSRSTKDLLDLTETFRNKGVSLISVKEKLDTTTPEGKLMMTMLAALSQFERDLIAERTKDGLKAARARGRQGGRPKAGTDKDKAKALAMYDANIMTNAEIAQSVGVSTATFNRWIAERKRLQKESGE